MSRKTLKIIFIISGIIIAFVLFFIFYSKVLNKNILIKNKTDYTLIDTVTDEEYENFSGEIKSYYYSTHKINFSFLYKKDLTFKKLSGISNKWFDIYKTKGEDVLIYFIYTGNKNKDDQKFTSIDYINNNLNKNNNLEIKDIRFSDNEEATTSIRYLLDKDNNKEYFLADIINSKNEPWILIIENNKADNLFNQDIARDVIRSFEAK